MKRLLFALILLAAFQTMKAQETIVLDSTTLTSRVVKEALDIPWEIIWGPDDHIWCTERFGRVSRINPETGNQEILLNISDDVYEQSEAGMLGMVLHPDFENTPHVFIANTYLLGNDILERLVKYEYTGSSLISIDTLIENITGNTTHIGCRLVILPDNSLLMTTGDAQIQSLPQDINSVVGKILRMNLDGSIPSDNPDPTSLVYSFGHRNAQGLWLAPNGKIYSSEHGPTTDDEINIIEANNNYGWPNVTGYCNTPPEIGFCNDNDVTEPIAAYTPTIAPSDIIWYDHPSIPEFQDKLLMTVLKDKSLIAYSFNETGDQVTDENKYFKNDFGRLRDICISPSGKIYLATNGSSWSNNNPFTHSIIELSNESFVSSTISTIKNQINADVYPNPILKGRSLIVEVDNDQPCTMTLYDISGQVILSESIFNKTTIELDTAAGIYFYRILDQKGNQTSGKLVIN